MNKTFLHKALKYGFEAENVGKLIAHLSFECDLESQTMVDVFLTGINQGDYQEGEPYFTALNHFLKIKDSLQIKRLEWIFGIPCLIDGNVQKAGPFELP